MKIVVLAGGLSPERNVSLSTGTMVTEALRALGHRAGLIDLYFGLETGGADEAFFDAPVSEAYKKISRGAPDLDQVRRGRKGDSPSMFGPGVLELCWMADMVFLALHGTCGEDGRVQAAFDLMGIPYTGAGYLGSAIAMDKDLTKRMVADVVSTPGWKTVTYTAADIDRLVETARLPLVVKPVASGSSIGVSIAHTAEELRRSLTEGLALGGRTVLEEYIRGREIQVGILEDKALPSIEIIPKQGFYDYANKYQPGSGGLPGGDYSGGGGACAGRGPAGVRDTGAVGVLPRGLHPHGGRGALVPGDQHPARHDTHQPAAPGGRGGGH